MTAGSPARPRPPSRVKNTFAPPQVCVDCYWEKRVKTLETMNKRLRSELVKKVANKRFDKHELDEREREDASLDVPDLLDTWDKVNGDER